MYTPAVAEVERVRRFVERLKHLKLAESKQRSNDQVRSAALPGDDLQYTVTGYLYNMSESQRGETL